VDAVNRDSRIERAPLSRRGGAGAEVEGAAIDGAAAGAAAIGGATVGGAAVQGGAVAGAAVEGVGVEEAAAFGIGATAAPGCSSSPSQPTSKSATGGGQTNASEAAGAAAVSEGGVSDSCFTRIQSASIRSSG